MFRVVWSRDGFGVEMILELRWFWSRDNFGVEMVLESEKTSMGI